MFLAANVTRNMIGAAANNYMHVIGSQERNAEQWGGSLRDDPNNGCEGDFMYGLLTKREVKMTGYWPSSFFACL